MTGTASGPSPQVGKPQTSLTSAVKPLGVCTCQIAKVKERKRHFGTQKKSKYNKEVVVVKVIRVDEFPRHRLEEVYRSNEKKMPQISWRLLIFVCMLLKIII